jgi:hypothetical protein
MPVCVDPSWFGEKSAAVLDQPLALFEPQNEAVLLNKMDSAERAHRIAGLYVQRFRPVLKEEDLCQLGFDQPDLHKREPPAWLGC